MYLEKEFNITLTDQETDVFNNSHSQDIRKEMKRYIIYFIGVVILATGLTLNTKRGWVCHPIISVPFRYQRYLI